jgi:hypothetical protein
VREGERVREKDERKVKEWREGKRTEEREV